MKLLSLFKRKPESPAEKQALANLDAVTGEVAWGEADNVPEPEDDRSLRDVLREDEKP
jgi:hypothetical protein